MSFGVTPPTNSGIMDFNCNFPDQNHKQFERPNLLNPNFSDVEPKYEITLGAAYSWSLQRFCWIKSIFGQRERQQCRDEFAKGQIFQ